MGLNVLHFLNLSISAHLLLNNKTDRISLKHSSNIHSTSIVSLIIFFWKQFFKNETLTQKAGKFGRLESQGVIIHRIKLGSVIIHLEIIH